jgi:hypothetical protein
MKYMLLIYMGENALNEKEREDCYVESTQLAHDLHAGGKFLGANPLHPVSTATTVRIRDGKRLVTDGPFAETKEQLGGYYLIDVPNLDEAVKWGSKCPGAKTGSIEVRPLNPHS